MVVFDKNITLGQKLGEYGKETLKDFAGDLGLRKLSRLKKADLIEKIAEKLLNPETMFYRAAILTDKEIAVLEKGFDGPVKIGDKDINPVGTLNQMEFIAVSNGEYLVPCDVASAWKRVKDDRFEAYRKRASWVWKCLYWAEEMYVFTPLEIMLEVINVKKGFRMRAEELKEIFNNFPKDYLWSINFDEFFLSRIYVTDMDALRSLRHAQAEKSYYIPTAAEVDEFFETGALLSDRAYQDMLSFMKKELGLNHAEAKNILFDLWEKVSDNDDPHGTMQWFWNKFEFEDEKQLERIVNLYTRLANETRMRTNRGHKPTELRVMSNFGSGNMPVITAGSSHAAEMLAQIAPQIQQMGFELDLESNAGSVPVMEFPNGIEGGMQMREKKIYPNDPCPCGSGKKYKKCCGRN